MIQLAPPRPSPTTASCTGRIWSSTSPTQDRREDDDRAAADQAIPSAAANIETMKKALVGVIRRYRARAFAGAGYEAAGKTGTAQVSASGEAYTPAGQGAPARPRPVHCLARRPKAEDRAGGRWSRTAVSVPSRRHRSRAWFSTTTCSARCPPGPRSRILLPWRLTNDEFCRIAGIVSARAVDHLDPPLPRSRWRSWASAWRRYSRQPTQNRLMRQFINMAVALA